jgi:hypothetical protein
MTLGTDVSYRVLHSSSPLSITLILSILEHFSVALNSAAYVSTGITQSYLSGGRNWKRRRPVPVRSALALQSVEGALATW